jgi:hypothetical protein
MVLRAIGVQLAFRTYADQAHCIAAMEAVSVSTEDDHQDASLVAKERPRGNVQPHGAHRMLIGNVAQQQDLVSNTSDPPESLKAGALSSIEVRVTLQSVLFSPQSALLSFCGGTVWTVSATDHSDFAGRREQRAARTGPVQQLWPSIATDPQRGVLDRPSAARQARQREAWAAIRPSRHEGAQLPNRGAGTCARV